MNARAWSGIARRNPGLGALVAVLALSLVNLQLTPGFFASSTLWSVVIQSVTTLLVGAGMTLVIATGGIDLSVGSVMAVASAVTVTLLPHGLTIAACAGLLLAVALGGVNGFLIARYRILPIVVTLATLMMGRGIAQVIVAGNPLVTFTNPAFERFGRGYLGPVPVQVVLATLIVALCALLLRSTVWGRYLLAVGGNERAARLAGVRVLAVKVLVYALSGLLAGVSGLIETARLAATDAGTIGIGAELDAIVAVVIGGTPLSGGRARMGGMVLGALLMNMLSATFAMHLVPHAWSLVVKAVILAVAVTAQRGSGS